MNIQTAEGRFDLPQKKAINQYLDFGKEKPRTRIPVPKGRVILPKGQASRGPYLHPGSGDRDFRVFH